MYYGKEEPVSYQMITVSMYCIFYLHIDNLMSRLWCIILGNFTLHIVIFFINIFIVNLNPSFPLIHLLSFAYIFFIYLSINPPTHPALTEEC